MNRLKSVATFKYLGTTLTNQNDIHYEIKSRLKLGNACYYSVQNLLSSRLISKNLKITIYKTVIFLVVLYECETWSLTLREERGLRVFENRVLRKIFGSKREEESRDSSVGIATGYRTDNRGSRVRFSAGAGNFSLHHRVQNGSGVHPASYPMGTRGSFRGGKAAEA
jgi:hypothetical protein